MTNIVLTWLRKRTGEIKTSCIKVDTAKGIEDLYDLIWCNCSDLVEFKNVMLVADNTRKEEIK